MTDETETPAQTAEPTGDSFEDAAPPYKGSGEQLVLDLNGFEGPIDVLLSLARDQKVDLTKISILQLADQYLAFISEARRLRLELAADYLVMAAWLAFLKSRLLLPATGGEEEPSAAEMAARLAFQLQRLDAMRQASEKLFARAQLGQDFFRRGDPERMPVIRSTVYDVTLFELLSVYGAYRQRKTAGTMTISPMEVFSIEEALIRLRNLVGNVPEWTSLMQFLPPGLQPGGITYKSAIATTFVATLELARTRQIRLQQSGAFEPIYIKTYE